MKNYMSFCCSVCIKMGFLAILFLGYQSNAQTGGWVLNGRVVDEKSQPVAGATASIIGTNRAAVSDNNGSFIIEVRSPEDSLEVSFTGYFTQRLRVGNSRQLTITLLVDVQRQQMDEVVVTAFGRRERKEAIVGSVTSVNVEELKTPSSNLTNSFAGRIAGMISYQRSGQPGADDATFFIRGVTSFGYSRDPLILIDNIESTTSALARINPDDIASFSILKDATASALYGARGANGVILITTKEGRTGKAQIDFRFENSISEPTKSLKVADPITYMNLYNEAVTTRTPDAQPMYSANDIENTRNGINRFAYPATDWFQTMFKDRGNSYRANMSVSGGGGVARYFVSGYYGRDNGNLKVSPINDFNNNVKFQNYQLRSNVNVDVTPSTELIVRLAGTFNDFTGPITTLGSNATDLYFHAMHASPVDFAPYYEPDSANRFTNHILFGNYGSNNDLLVTNPYALLLRGYQGYSQSNMKAQLDLNQELNFITPGLVFRGFFSTERYSAFSVQRAYNPFYYNIRDYNPVTDQYSLTWLNSEPGQATEYLSFSPGVKDIFTNITMQGAIDYARTFNTIHAVSATVVGVRQERLNANANDPATNMPSLQYSLPYRNLGFSGRFSYAFRNKYFTELNFGYNGTERFDQKNRFGFFPSVGVSYIVSNEEFWENMANVISRLKLRASYGLVGNDAISNQRFFYLSNVNLNPTANYGAVFGRENGYSRPGVSISTYGNPDVTWETSRQLNLATEMEIAKKVGIIAEYYRYYKYNIYQTRGAVPAEMGLEASVGANLGEVLSQGVDLSADYKQTFSNGLFLQFRGNFTYATNEITKWDEPEYVERYRSRVGQSVDANWGYIAERLFVDDREAANSPQQQFGGQAVMGGDIKYRDVNGDGVINLLDATWISMPTVPEIIYGAGISANYKGFDLSMFFQGLAREAFYINQVLTQPFRSGTHGSYGRYFTTQVLQAYADNHWSEDNQDLYALWPRLTILESGNNDQPSTWWLRNGSFLRLKQLEFGYTLPDRILGRFNARSTRIYFNGVNLFTWSKFRLWDPELGGNAFNYPIQRVYNIGLQINL